MSSSTWWPLQTQRTPIQPDSESQLSRWLGAKSHSGLWRTLPVVIIAAAQICPVSTGSFCPQEVQISSTAMHPYQKHSEKLWLMSTVVDCRGVQLAMLGACAQVAGFAQVAC